MDATHLRKAFSLIAAGLIEKDQLLQKQPTRYPYSKKLQHSMGMFLAASRWAGCRDVMRYANETAFFAHFITSPIREWFDDWNPEVLAQLELEQEPYYAYDAFAYRIEENRYVPSDDCYEYLDSQDSDIMDGTDERILYDKMKQLTQEDYCKLRKYIIGHPIITREERQEMSLELAEHPVARESLQFAYEELTQDCYRCPKCGWTMTVGKYGPSCHSVHCMDVMPNLTEKMKLDASSGNLYRLKKGIMRYIAAPGRLELEIAEYCEKKKLRWSLWPQMDRYDVEIQFPDGEVWAVDAKAYRNPTALRTKIQKDQGFPEGEYTRGYYVVPTEYTANQNNYTRIINRVLEKQPNVKCITMHKLKTEIARKVSACHGE